MLHRQRGEGRGEEASVGCEPGDERTHACIGAACAAPPHPTLSPWGRGPRSRPPAALFLLAALALLLPAAVGARAAEIVDVAGRTVELARPAARVLLGEGRFLVALSLLVPDDPVARVAGMLGELPRYDPDGFTRYLEAFPELAEVPLFGQTTAESVSAETALALGADAAVFGLSGHGPNRASEALVARLEAAGVAVVFIDFRDDPLVNTPKSMRILGQLLGLEARAEDFAALYETEVARVIGPVASIEEPRPSVLLEAHVGLRPGCCFTIARGMLASLIEAAGGRNIAAGRLPGVAGELALEYVITEDPDVYIGTAIGSRSGGTEESGRILLGPGAAQTAAAETLARALERPGIATLSAVRAGHAYAIWHHFYNSPLNVYALQRFAAWLHPDRFHDLDPEATLRRLMERLGPLDLRGAYAVGLDASD